MQATSLALSNIFTGYRIFDIPFYQRAYVWEKEQWQRFLEDMELISKLNKDYFLGCTILKQENTNLGANDHITIIDGQQRFTTIAIFCKALCLKTDEMDVFNRYFMVRNKKTQTRSCALVHGLNDRKDFERVIGLTEDSQIETESKSHIIQAYNFFQKNIDIEKVDIDSLMKHITFIDIELHQEDDEQTIFDTINSLGVRLTTAELLKNYFFTESTVEEYRELWVPVFEKNQEVYEYWNSQITAGRVKKNNIDAFFTAFLNIKIQDPKLKVDNEHKMLYRRADSIFASYKDMISTYHLDKKELYWEIVEYAELYAKYINSNVVDSDLSGKSCIERVNFMLFTLDCLTLLPYVLYVLRNVHDEKERNGIFGYLESYVVRRIICKSDNKNFSDLFSEMLIGNEIKTLEGLKQFIEGRSEMALKFPDDELLQESVHEVEQPNKRGLAILYLMETRIRHRQPHATKLLSFSEYTLEHIMPKKYEKNWPLRAGYDEQTRRQMINTLGNMAMLPQRLNSSISNANWEVKKNGNAQRKGLSYFASDIVILKGVVARKEWNEDTIFNHAEWLADTAITIWPQGEEDESPIEPEVVGGEDKPDETPPKPTQKHDTTKYSFDGIDFLTKLDFVFEYVKQYVSAHPEMSYEDLKDKFQDKYCSGGYKFIGFLCTDEEYQKWDNAYKEKRYHPKRRKLVSSDGVVFYVNSQWTKQGVDGLVKMAKADGFKVYTKSKA